jgi:hypothetical protein
MAIKGKAKGRSRRVVAAPPKPTTYIRKPPIIRRPWFITAVAVAAVAGILSAVLIRISNDHREARRADASTAVTEFARQVEATFPPAPDSQAQAPTGYLIYPSLISDLDNVAKGSKKIDGAAKGTSLETSAKSSGDAIAKINVGKLVPEDADYSEAPGLRGPGATRLVLVESQYLMEQAFVLYQRVGGLMAQAATLEGKARTDLIDEAKNLTTDAQGLFRRGYEKIVTLKGQLGLLQLNSFPGAGQGGP